MLKPWGDLWIRYMTNAAAGSRAPPSLTKKGRGAACDSVAQNPAYKATALPFLFYYIFAGHSTSPTHIFKPTPYMTQPFTTLVRFLRHDLWHVQRHNTTALAYCCCSLLKKLLLAVEFFTTRCVIDMAAALTYSTLLALVPILAVVFGVARGFGYNKYIEVWFRELLGSQPQAADAIINFVNSYLVHTKSGVLLGVGLVLMLYTVLMLTLNVEKTFNTIWQVKHRRSLYRAVTDYLAMLLLVPVVIVLVSGLSIAGARLLPYVLMAVVFMAMYMCVPNTKVRLQVVIVPGILAGVGMQALQLFYIHAQVLLSSYNAIYGSFAALPLFMLWVQLSWTICLFGVQLCYTNQNMDELSFRLQVADISPRYRLLLAIILMSRVCQRFADGKRPYTALDLRRLTNIPIRITQDLLYMLVRAGLLSENSADGKDQEPTYQPAMTLQKLTVGAMVERLDSMGGWHLDIDLHEQLAQVEWKQYLALREQYLAELRKLPLCKEEGAA